ncbi:MAG TPA: hypothetical protein VN933_06865 [Candidatus Eremiobacteraceae bacterium]|jgi:Tfp pilus assembly protein PilF|nr:hypothetical protein [Candidatus Eremiobacteraceae bacterium]
MDVFAPSRLCVHHPCANNPSSEQIGQPRSNACDHHQCQRRAFPTRHDRCAQRRPNLRNSEAYPQSYNTYDSLAEAYMDHGDRDLAIQNHRKSLDLNPSNANGAKMLQKLSAQ